MSAEYVGTPPKNGFYKRQIWVRKSLVEKLPANHSMQGKPTVPPRHFYSLEERNDPLVPKSNIPQKEYYNVDPKSRRKAPTSLVLTRAKVRSKKIPTLR